MEMPRSWQELGVVDTIYETDHEEDEEEERFNSPSLSSLAATPSWSPSPPPSMSSVPPPLQSAVRNWSRANGCYPDVIVRVQEQCFPLHRDPIAARSSYLKRQFSESSEITLVLPGGLTVETFAAILAFCYTSEDIALSPSNLAAVWAAAVWLELTADDDGLLHLAEDYFFREVAPDEHRAAAVLRSCTSFLEGEATGAVAALAVRCLEVLAVSGGADSPWLEDVVATLSVHAMLVLAEAMQARFVYDHDLLYTIVDHYLENHKGKLSEDDKNLLCYNVNCTKLSQDLFMHLVQNPRLPLRFVVQAMLVEQLHSHHSMLHHAAAVSAPPIALTSSGATAAGEDAVVTLGDILQRDSVLRQSTHLRAALQATHARIESLESELAGLRHHLQRSEQAMHATAKVDRPSARSASFSIARGGHLGGEAGTADSRAGATGKDGRKDAKRLGAKLVQGFKSLFRWSGNGGLACGGNSLSGAEGQSEVVAEPAKVMQEERRPGHRRHKSTL